MESDVFLRAADIFVERTVPHVCWAVGMADGYPSREYAASPAVQWFQSTFAAPGTEVLSAGDILNASDDDREFSLLLLAMAAAQS